MAEARSGAVGNPLLNDRFLLVAGGKESKTAELYGFATIQTDKSDYTPGETVIITGSGWQPGETVTLILQEETKKHPHRPLTAVADSAGNIFNNQFSPDKHDYGVLFYLTAKDSRSQAQNIFTDAGPAANLDQCRNGGVGEPPVPCAGLAWVNGNAGADNAHYVEGGSIPYRAKFTNLKSGEIYSATIEWDTTRSGKHALDYLTTFNRTEVTADPCSDVAGVNCFDIHTFGIPLDPNVSAGGATQIGDQQFTAYGGTITGVSAYTLAGDYTGSSSTSVSVTFTANANGAVVLAWGGHISTRVDWGFDNSAVSISGSPYHMRLIDFACSDVSNCGVGNQDRGVSAAAVIFPGNITIVKHASPLGSEVFQFSGTPNPPVADFTLVDSSDTTDPSHSFENLTIFGTYTITESVPSSWALDSITCGLPTGGTGGTSASSSGSTLTISLAEGDSITCTFNNRELVGRIIVKKLTNPSSDTSTSFTFTPTGYNGGNSFSLVNGGINTSEKLQSGSYSVTESTVPAGWDLTSLSCVTSGPNGSVGTPDSLNPAKANIDLRLGDAVTCTFTNTERSNIIVNKLTDPAGDTTTSFAFTPSYNGGVGFSLTNGGSNDSGLQVPGSYSVSEAAFTGWYLIAASCDNGDLPSSITLAAGQTVSCTFTNTQRGRIIVNKLTDPASDTTTSFSFTPSYNGGAGFSLTNGGSNDSGLQVPGSYSVSEAAFTGWDLIAASCDNGDLPSSITLAAGQTVSCTFTNTQRGRIIVNKLTDPASDTTTSFSFTPSYNGGAGFSLTNGGSNDSGLQVPGSYSVSEAAFTGWYLIAASCDNGDLPSSITLAAGQTVTCTFTNYLPPDLAITKTPDKLGDPGYEIHPGDTARFTITVTKSLFGPTDGVILTDTLPSGVGNWTENPDTLCTITEGINLSCYIGTLAAGATFSVTVQATIPTNYLLPPALPPGSSSFEIDGNLAVDTIGNKDWANIGISCTSTPKLGCVLDGTGNSDDSFGQGTKEDTPVPIIVTGSIPKNKSDLTRFYVAHEKVSGTDFLYLAWERVQAPSGQTNMDFELNQSRTLSSNGVTTIRTAGDLLIKYDLDNGGTTPTLGYHVWVTEAPADGKAPNEVCEASNAFPCWDKVHALTTAVAGAVNTSSVQDPILEPGQTSPRTLDPLTFGEALIDFQSSGIFPVSVTDPSQCVSFDQAYLKSRSSSSFTSEIKDFVAPIAVAVSNCPPKHLNNQTFVQASDFGQISDTGQITVESILSLEAVSVTPDTGGGQSPQVFSYLYFDAKGYQNITNAYTLLHSTLTWADSCGIMYLPASSSLYLRADDGSGFLGPMTLGQPGTLQNSQCTLDAGASSASGSGTNLTLNLALSFQPSFVGLKNHYMRAADGVNNLDSGWQLGGTWAPGPPAMPSAVSVSPSFGWGTSQTFTYLYSDASGYQNISNVFTILNTTESYVSSCTTMYLPASGNLYLAQDTGSGWLGPVTIGQPGTLQNSQCTLDAAASSASGSETNLTVNLELSFSSSFVGLKNHYMRAADGVNNLDSGWQLGGTWTIDSIAPETIITSAPEAQTNSTEANFSFTSSEAGSTFECRLDGAAFTACTDPQSYTGLAAGSHTFDVRATDAAANTDATPASHSWTWTPAMPSAVSVSPNSGSGTSQTFTYFYTDASGYQYITDALALVNSTQTWTGSCGIAFKQATDSLLLANDDGSGWLGPVTIGQPGTLQNSQCTLDAGASSASGSGSNLTLNLALSFQPSFAGLKNHYVRADDNVNNLSSGWQLHGTWTPSPAPMRQRFP